MTPQPVEVRLRVYQVGFGDCVLLTVSYASALDDGRAERHMLVDFGSREQRKGGPNMADIAAKIVEHCDRLDVVVATHRHQDHIKGFGDQTARAHLDTLTPGMVVRPWTDVPEAHSSDPSLALDDASQQFISLLEGMHRGAESIDALFDLDDGAIATRAKELAALGFKNGPAVATLEQWAEAGTPAWVKAGDDLDLDDVMPEVTVRVLGPPTLAEVDKLTSYAKESEEYWLALAADGDLAPMVRSEDDGTLEEALATVAGPDGNGAAAWLVRELGDQQRLQALHIVEGFDDVLNNTSVILLVTVGDRTMLFAGDAQAENWSLTLDQALGHNGRNHDPQLAQQLADVDVYKVGHHGSLNATPHRLYGLWEPHRTPQDRPLLSVLTTLSGVYDKSKEGAVPKKELVEALEQLGPLHSTEKLPKDVWWFDLVAPAFGAAEFIYTEGEPVP